MIGKHAHTRNLWGKEFSIVGEGLAEAEVVAFVSELLQRQHHQSLMELAQRTVIEAEKLGRSLREKARGEAEAEAARIVSQAQARAEDIDQQAQQAALSLKENAREEAEDESTTLISQAQARAEEIAEAARQAALSQFREKVSARTQRLHDRLLEMVQEELGKEGDKMVGPAPTAPTPQFPQPEPADPLTQKIEEALANWQAMPTNSDALPNPEGNPVPELFTEVPQANGENLVSGEVDLIVAPPIDLAQLTSFQRRLRKQSEVRLIQTVGSWNQGLAITVLIKQPLSLMETLEEMPEVERVQGSNGAEKEAGKELRKKVNITLRRRPRQKTEGSGVGVPNVQDDLR